MKNIPHDYYLRFIDPVAYDEVLDFHTKGNFLIHEAFKDSTALYFLNPKDLACLTGNELHLYPDMQRCLPLNYTKKAQGDLNRNESCERFSESVISFDVVERLMTPLISKSKKTYKRGYPSGGALYPIEVFVCSLMQDHQTWPCPEKILHLLPQTAQFEIIQGSENTDGLRSAILAAPADIGSPSVAIVYAAYLPKTFFKYRYRGYRLALMEVGSIYMLIELQAKKLKLRSRLWSAYSDTMLCKAIGLNPTLFLPLCVHFLGGSE
ncbi:SagB/ThcOx family dehydrogenase [Pseudomonas sp. NPDC086278]|uniref:SagB/ThcOx family dehydrogenase n=1 Tax=Pseudomonas sp. NPDC086278 TaxID=3390646 RepID=UPI003D06D015